jgi:hypothetical protein
MDPDPDPTPDQTPFLSDFNFAKKNYFCSYFFLRTYPQAHYLRSYEKREGSGAGSGSWRPKNMQILGILDPVLDLDPQH